MLWTRRFSYSKINMTKNFNTHLSGTNPVDTVIYFLLLLVFLIVGILWIILEILFWLIFVIMQTINQCRDKLNRLSNTTQNKKVS